MSPDVAELNGTYGRVDDDDYEYGLAYYAATHAYDNEAPGNCDYNELSEDQGNRWHIQSWFYNRPDIHAKDEYGRDVTVRPSLSELNYRMESNTDGGRFQYPTPNDSEISHGEAYNRSIDVSFGAVLQAGPAFISVEPNSSSDYCLIRNYDYVEWNFGSTGWIDDQNDTAGDRPNGAKVDVIGTDDNEDLYSFTFKSQAIYRFYDRRGFVYQETPELEFGKLVEQL